MTYWITCYRRTSGNKHIQGELLRSYGRMAEEERAAALYGYYPSYRIKVRLKRTAA